MCVLNSWIVCKRKTIWWRNWRSWQTGRRQPRLWGRQHVNLCKTHTLFGDFAKLISICIEFTILPGSHLLLKVFWTNLTSILIPTRFPRLFFQVSEPISAFCRSGSSFCFRRCVAYGEALEWYHSSPRLSNSRAIRWPVMSRATEATTLRQLERSRKGSCWASNHAGEAHTHLIWRPSRAVLGWMSAHPRGTLMSVRTLHAETSHALRIAGCEGDLCCLE